MSVEEMVVALIVGAAAGYLVWKLGLEGASTPPKKRGPDVKVDRLKRSAKKER